jgi:hypothetical protein
VAHWPLVHDSARPRKADLADQVSAIAALTVTRRRP